jgi:hypothetical protein
VAISGAALPGPCRYRIAIGRSRQSLADDAALKLDPAPITDARRNVTRCVGTPVENPHANDGARCHKRLRHSAWSRQANGKPDHQVAAARADVFVRESALANCETACVPIPRTHEGREGGPATSASGWEKRQDSKYRQCPPSGLQCAASIQKRMTPVQPEGDAS